jgi:hypothetical protein
MEEWVSVPNDWALTRPPSEPIGDKHRRSGCPEKGQLKNVTMDTCS